MTNKRKITLAITPLFCSHPHLAKNIYTFQGNRNRYFCVVILYLAAPCSSSSFYYSVYV